MIQPPFIRFASKLMSLFSRSVSNSSKQQSTKIKDPYMHILPDDMHSAIQMWALVTQEKEISPLGDTTPITSNTRANTLDTGSHELSTMPSRPNSQVSCHAIPWRLLRCYRCTRPSRPCASL
eukprot:scaffold229046_cov21-Tisochrysis_lutea.AAC.1